MRDSIELGSTPYEETCAQVGAPDYRARALAECKALIAQLYRENPGIDSLVDLRVLWHPHDFGNYAEVSVFFDDASEESTVAAYMVEENFPAYWDELARAELGIVTA